MCLDFERGRGKGEKGWCGVWDAWGVKSSWARMRGFTLELSCGAGREVQGGGVHRWTDSGEEQGCSGDYFSRASDIFVISLL